MSTSRFDVSGPYTRMPLKYEYGSRIGPISVQQDRSNIEFILDDRPAHSCH